jgi:hypothetical protein
MRIKSILVCGLLTFHVFSFLGCKPKEEEKPNYKIITQDTVVTGDTNILPHIDLRHWKVTLPIGAPTEVSPPAILGYATNTTLKPYMYDDPSDGSLVFYTIPQSSTANSSYSRTELRELLDGGDGKTNWKFADGGRIKGRLKIGDISVGSSGYDKTIVMQIHGRLSDAQKALIGASDNNAPPILKLSWQSGKIRLFTKVLKDTTVNEVDVLKEDSWTDKAITFNKTVNFDEFTLEVIVSDGRMEVILNGDESMVFDDIHIKRWGVFENYFKAGNYLQTTATGSFAKVKYYDLTVTH